VLESVVHFLRQQYRVILSVWLLSIALGVTYLMVARPSYTAVATMLIENRKSQFSQQTPLSSDALIDTAAVESQVIVLKSDDLALSVIKKLRLNEDPEFIGSDSKSGPADLYNAAISAIKKLQLTVLEKLQLNEDPGLFELGSKSSPAPEYLLMRRALDIFKSRLDVKRASLSYVEVSFVSYNAEKAARIANAIVDAYIVDQLDAKYQATLHAGNWLHDRIRDLREQASAAEQAVVDYRWEHNIIDAAPRSGKRITTHDQRVNELNGQLIIEIGRQRNYDVQREYGQAVVPLRQAQVVLSDLEAKSKNYRGLYENFLQRYLDTVQEVQQQYRPTEARLISSATRPSRQSSPKAVLTLIFSACAGIIFGFGIGVWRSMTIRTTHVPP
jgi:polysaccharide biosynthesis transport protein